MNLYIDVYGIAYRCPFIERVQACPLMEIAALPFKEKVIWIDAQFRDTIDSILSHHLSCLNRRESLGFQLAGSNISK